MAIQSKQELTIDLGEFQEDKIRIIYQQCDKFNYKTQQCMNLHLYSQQESSHNSSVYSSKSSKKYDGKPIKIPSMQNSCEFSFNKGQFDSGKNSIREDLIKLTKQDLIEIVLQEVDQTKMLRIKLATMQDQFKIMGSFRDDSIDFNNTQDYVPMTKYKELADYMEEYISNTNQAQTYFSNLIRQLKAENISVKQANKKYEQQLAQGKAQQHNHQAQIVKELEETIRNLEDSVTHYMNINNEHTRKYEKLKKMYDALENQLTTALDSFHHQDESLENPLKQCTGKENSGIQKCGKEDEDLKSRVKLLEIQNTELKEAWLAMEKALQGKSEKIRKLLQQMQKLSEQKWIYKQKYLELKSKSSLLTQSSSKNTAYDSCIQNEVNIDEFGSLN